MKIEITVTQEQMDRLNNLRKTTMAGERADEVKSVDEMVYQVIERGLYTIEYTRKQYQEKKMANKIMKMVQKDPTMAVKFGLARTESFVVADANEPKEHRG